MLTTIAIVATVATSVSAYDPSSDPSLQINSQLTETTLDLQMPSSVLSFSGVQLTWDDQFAHFKLNLNGSAVTDLVSFTDSRGWPSFEGDFQSGVPQVFGSVLLDSATVESYTVELTLPGEKPASYGVANVDGGSPIIGQAKECDCSDNIDLSCTTIKCRNQDDCGMGGGDENCEWQDTAVPQ